MRIQRNDDRPAADTLAKLLLACERHHDREAVVRWREEPEAKTWASIPDWRFERQILRFAAYLKERVGAREGEHLLIHAPASVETLVAQSGALLLGMTVGVIDPRVESDTACAVARGFAPRVVVAPSRSAAALGRIDGVMRIVLGPRLDIGAAESLVSWGDALDLAGTLDTAERAEVLRAGAASLAPRLAALAWPHGTNGEAEWVTLSHAGAVDRVRRLWTDVPPRLGAKRYVDPASTDLATRLALLAAILDGMTCASLGPDEAAPAPEARPKKATRLSRAWSALRNRFDNVSTEERRS
jgi:hypothetical protein